MSQVAPLLALLRKLAMKPETWSVAADLAQKIAKQITDGGFSESRKRRALKATAELLAQQTTNAKLSYGTVLQGERYTVVWIDDKPREAFPQFEGALGHELRDFDTSRLVDPPVARSRIWEAEWWAPPGKARVWQRNWWLPPGKKRIWSRPPRDRDS